MKELLKRIAKALDDEGLAYMVIGGQAVLIYGEPRFTRTLNIFFSGLRRLKGLW